MIKNTINLISNDGNYTYHIYESKKTIINTSLNNAYIFSTSNGTEKILLDKIYGDKHVPCLAESISKFTDLPVYNPKDLTVINPSIESDNEFNFYHIKEGSIFSNGNKLYIYTSINNLYYTFEIINETTINEFKISNNKIISLPDNKYIFLNENNDMRRLILIDNYKIIDKGEISITIPTYNVQITPIDIAYVKQKIILLFNYYGLKYMCYITLDDIEPKRISRSSFVIYRIFENNDKLLSLGSNTCITYDDLNNYRIRTLSDYLVNSIVNIVAFKDFIYFITSDNKLYTIINNTVTLIASNVIDLTYSPINNKLFIIYKSDNITYEFLILKTKTRPIHSHKIIKSEHPINSIYQSNINPFYLLGFGTWSKMDSDNSWIRIK